MGADITPTLARKLRRPRHGVSYGIQYYMPIEVRRTEDWLRKLRDPRARAKILVRIDRLAHGNPGDVEAVGECISEQRIHHGPGYRVYYVQRGTRYILLLAGGDKKRQDRDIAEAKRLASEYEE